jgi:hypothetical protein
MNDQQSTPLIPLCPVSVRLMALDELAKSMPRRHRLRSLAHRMVAALATMRAVH